MAFFDVLDRLPDVISLWLLTSLVGATLCGYYFIFRGHIKSIFDPLGAVLLFSSFATAFLIVLATAGLVEPWALAYVAAVLAFFYAPLLATRIRPSVARRCFSAKIAMPTTESLLALLLLQTLLQGVTYLAVGIPILQESRLTLYESGGGIGALGRFKDGLEIASVVLPFIALRGGRKGRVVAWLLLAAVAIGALLSGSKGAILVLPFGWYLGGVYVTGSWRVSFILTKGRLGALTCLLMVPIGVTMWRSQGGSSALFQSAQDFVVRLIAEGDGYAYFFGGNRINDIARPDFLALIRPITTALRITDPAAAVTPGFEIVRELFGADDSTWGPNTRLPIYLLYFYGAWGLMIAPLLGWCLALARRRTLNMAQSSPARFAIACSVYAAMTRTEVDPQIMVNGLFNVLVSLPLLLAATNVVRRDGRAVPVNVANASIAESPG